MSEMIERGARALALRHGEEWGRLDPQMREGYRDDVRTVIATMRLPTIEMARVGRINGIMAQHVWDAMLDAALEP